MLVRLSNGFVINPEHIELIEEGKNDTCIIHFVSSKWKQVDLSTKHVLERIGGR